MKKVVLIFPDTLSMADFILTQRVSNAEVNSVSHTIVAPMTDKQIIIAETEYGAILKALRTTNL
jgi:hypothetical protein